MNDLMSDLFQLMEEYYEAKMIHTPQYEEYFGIYRRNLEKVQIHMGQDFRDKLGDAISELMQLKLEAAFLWGLRLGLALHTL